MNYRGFFHKFDTGDKEGLSKSTSGGGGVSAPAAVTRTRTIKRIRPVSGGSHHHHHAAEALIGRSSIRSKGSSANSDNKLKVLKNCFRSTVEFMFTQVGVGGVVIAYTILGAVAFQAIETSNLEDPTMNLVEDQRGKIVSDLWNLTKYFNVLNRQKWSREVNYVLFDHQERMVQFIKNGYDQRTIQERWTFPAALMFTLRNLQ